nr:uncharacterized protein LOC109432332 [Aedes albopictus]
MCSVLAEYTPTELKVDKNLVLSSVYDAIRENGDRTLKIDPIDGRNKRNINYYTYDDYKSDDLIPSYGEVMHAAPMKQQCKSDPHGVQTISISDTHSWSSMGSSILKYLMMALALIALPVLLFQAFIIPLKVLMGLKTMAFGNTLLLATFLWRYLTRPNNDNQGEDNDNDRDHGTKDIANEVEDRFYYPFNTEDLDNLNEGEIKTILKFIKMKNKRW